MRIAVATDHGGFGIKKAVIEAIESTGNTVIDLGAFDDKSSDYPDFARLAGEAILTGNADKAVIMCGSGIGICIAANKIKGIYAGLCHDVYSAHQSVEHDDINMLCMGGLVVGPALAKDIVVSFLKASLMSEPRYQRRIDKYRAIEKENFK